MPRAVSAGIDDNRRHSSAKDRDAHSSQQDLHDNADPSARRKTLGSRHKQRTPVDTSVTNVSNPGSQMQSLTNILIDESRLLLVDHVVTYSVPIRVYPVTHDKVASAKMTVVHLQVVVTWVAPNVEMLTPKLIDFGKLVVGDKLTLPLTLKNLTSET